MDCIIFYLSKLLQIILNIPELEYINHDQTHTWNNIKFGMVILKYTKIHKLY